MRLGRTHWIIIAGFLTATAVLGGWLLFGRGESSRPTQAAATPVAGLTRSQVMEEEATWRAGLGSGPASTARQRAIARLAVSRAVAYSDAHLVGIRFLRGASKPGVEVILRTDFPARALLDLGPLVRRLDRWSGALYPLFRLDDATGATVWIAGRNAQEGFVLTRPDLDPCQPMGHGQAMPAPGAAPAVCVPEVRKPGTNDAPVQVPAVTGMAPMRAYGVLCDAGLFPGRVIIRRSGAALAGGRDINRMMRASTVISSSPAAGADVPRSTAVDITIAVPSNWGYGTEAAAACDFGSGSSVPATR